LKVEGEQQDERLEDQVSDASLAALHPDDVVSHAIDLMLATGQGRIPVTDPKSGKLVGLLTRKDLLQVRATTSRTEAERHAYFKRTRK
jgi:CIC family chloride channel protein